MHSGHGHLYFLFGGYFIEDIGGLWLYYCDLCGTFRDDSGDDRRDCVLWDLGIGEVGWGLRGCLIYFVERPFCECWRGVWFDGIARREEE